MKEVITVELDRTEIEDAIAGYLAERGYKAKEITFDHNFESRKIDGAKVIVTKEEMK
ncbi:hypothetical protein [Bacillus sp. 1P02SD]|uniref:hypothetical protein n=1 Tax=Bacillus sp. 1P02SD TaxID=3132264 RepID=UPI0039A07377